MNYFAAFPVEAPGLVDGLRAGCPVPLRWFDPADLHVTLSFLGREDPARVKAIREVLGEIPFVVPEVALGRLRALPTSRRFSALAFEIGEGGEVLESLMLEWRGPLRAAARVEPERHRPFPHLTVARPYRRDGPARRREILAWARKVEAPQDPLTLTPPVLYGWAEDRAQRQFRVIG